jgi:hypothetical protein
MKKVPILLAVLAGLVMTESAMADAIIYAPAGTPNAVSYAPIVATTTGTEYLTVYGTTQADFQDNLLVSVGGGAYTDTGIKNALPDKTVSRTPAGFTYSFTVTAGQTISFELANANGQFWYSNSSLNNDRQNHIFESTFTGGALPQDPGLTVGSGIYIGFEDQNLNPLPSPVGDINYTDIQVILSTVAPVPELSTWAMLVVGFAGLGFMGYRRSRTQPAMASA